MSKKIPQGLLVPGYTISRIIKGGWQLAADHSSTNRKSPIEDMFAFFKTGITTFDCGDIYTGVEELIGEFRKQFKKKYGEKALEKIKIHTKYVPDLASLSHITQEDVEKIIDRSRQRLGMQKLDMVQFHFWDFDIPTYVQTARYLSELQKKGKIKNLSVTNFDVVHLQELLDAGVHVASNQVQYSLLDRRPEHGMVAFCKKNNIQLLCYGTVAGGFLSEKYLGVHEPLPPFENRSLTKYKLIIEEFGGYEMFQKLLKLLHSIAKKHGVSITTIASKYILDKPGVAGIIVGARNTDHLQDNIKIGETRLDLEDKKMIESVLQEARDIPGDIYSVERIKGGKHANVMKYNLNKTVSKRSERRSTKD